MRSFRVKPSWAVMKLIDEVGPRDEKMSSDPAIRLASFETPEDDLVALSASQNCLMPSR